MKSVLIMMKSALKMMKFHLKQPQTAVAGWEAFVVVWSIPLERVRLLLKKTMIFYWKTLI